MAVLRWALLLLAVTCTLVTLATGLRNGVWLIGVLTVLALAATAFFPVPLAAGDVSRLDELDRPCCLVDHAEADDCDTVTPTAAARMWVGLQIDDLDRQHPDVR